MSDILEQRVAKLETELLASDQKRQHLEDIVGDLLLALESGSEFDVVRARGAELMTEYREKLRGEI